MMIKRSKGNEDLRRYLIFFFFYPIDREDKCQVQERDLVIPTSREEQRGAASTLVSPQKTLKAFSTATAHLILIHQANFYPERTRLAR